MSISLSVSLGLTVSAGWGRGTSGSDSTGPGSMASRSNDAVPSYSDSLTRRIWSVIEFRLTLSSDAVSRKVNY